MRITIRRAALVGLAVTILTGSTNGAELQSDKSINLGEFQLETPAKWERKKPRSRIIQYELSAPPAKGDEIAGRLTIMAAGGSIEDNIERWYGQFTQPDGKPTKYRAELEKKEIAGQTVHLVDISGTYDDKPAPFAEGVQREHFRMLAAIITTDKANIYVKFYGPRKTIAEHEKAFRSMIDGLKPN